MPEVPLDDQIPVRVILEPALALGHELLELRVADPVVLPVVEHRQEHVDVRQHLAEPFRRLEGDVLVRALGVESSASASIA